MIEKIHRFVCVGNLNADLLFELPRLPSPHEKLRCESGAEIDFGGAAANTAHWLARMGHEVEMIGCVGEDGLGNGCIESLSRVGVETRQIQTTSRAATGLAIVFTGPNAENRMITSTGANREIDWNWIDLSPIGPGTHVHFSADPGERALEFLRTARSRGASVSSEFGGRQSRELAAVSHLAFMNWDELTRWLGNDPLSLWETESGLKSCALAVTKAQQGAVALVQGEILNSPARLVEVVDRTGGGDGFDAGVLSGISRRLPLKDGVISGLRLASLVLGGRGARPKIPDEDLQRLDLVPPTC